MAQVKLPLFLRHSIHAIAEISVSRVYYGFLRRLAHALCIKHHESGCRECHNYPHDQTERGTGKDRNSRDSLCHRHREWAHPGHCVSHLGSHIGHGYRHN